MMGPAPTVTTRTKYGRLARHTYTGRVFLTDPHGEETRANTNTGEAVHGAYYDVWEYEGDYVRCERVYKNRQARYVYDPGHGFRNMVNKAYQEGEIAWD